MKLKPYWVDTTAPFAHGEVGPVEDKVALAMIAAGPISLRTFWQTIILTVHVYLLSPRRLDTSMPRQSR